MIQLTYDRENSGRLPPLDDVVLHYARMVLDSVGGNKTQAAKKLGIDRRSLYRLIDKMKAREATDGEKEVSSWGPYEAATQDAPLSAQEPDHNPCPGDCEDPSHDKGQTGGATTERDDRIGIASDGEYTTDGVKW